MTDDIARPDRPDRPDRLVQAAERFVPPLLLQTLLRIEQAHSTDEVWEVFLWLGRQIGLDVVDYVIACDAESLDRPQLVRTTFDEAWLDIAQGCPHLHQTSVFRLHAVHHLTPILVGPVYLDAYGPLSPETRRHVELAARMGLEAGVAFPLRTDLPGHAAVLTFGGRLDRAGFDALIAAHGWTLHAAAQAGHLRHTALSRTESTNEAQLTDKQKELMTLVGQGLMDKQIAYQLGISFSAVRQRLAAVQTKTGAQNRAHLAALAMRVGLVPDPLPTGHAEAHTVFVSMADGRGARPRRLAAPPMPAAAE